MKYGFYLNRGRWKASVDTTYGASNMFKIVHTQSKFTFWISPVSPGKINAPPSNAVWKNSEAESVLFKWNKPGNYRQFQDFEVGNVWVFKPLPSWVYL